MAGRSSKEDEKFEKDFSDYTRDMLQNAKKDTEYIKAVGAAARGSPTVSPQELERMGEDYKERNKRENERFKELYSNAPEWAKKMDEPKKN